MASTTAWRNSALAVLAVSAVSLGGLTLLARDERVVRRLVPQLVSLAAGALLGAAFFQLVPEAYTGPESHRSVPATMLAGYAVFFLLEWLLHGAHHHHDVVRAAVAHGHGHGYGHTPDDDAVAAQPPPREAVVTLNLLGDGLHNLLDGMLIAATFLADPRVGVLATVAVSLHEIPREIGSFGVYVHGGVGAWRALGYNALTAALSLAGAAVTLTVGAHMAELARALLPFAAGNFVYIAASLLVPILRSPARPAVRALRLGLVAAGLAVTGVPALLR